MHRGFRSVLSPAIRNNYHPEAYDYATYYQADHQGDHHHQGSDHNLHSSTGDFSDHTAPSYPRLRLRARVSVRSERDHRHIRGRSDKSSFAVCPMPQQHHGLLQTNQRDPVLLQSSGTFLASLRFMWRHDPVQQRDRDSCECRDRESAGELRPANVPYSDLLLPRNKPNVRKRNSGGDRTDQKFRNTSGLLLHEKLVMLARKLC